MVWAPWEAQTKWNSHWRISNVRKSPWEITSQLKVIRKQIVSPVAESMPQEVAKPQTTPNPQADDVTSPERFSARGRVLRRLAYLSGYEC